MSTKTETLFEAYNKELSRLNRAIGIYDSLPEGAGAFGSIMIKDVVKRATDALNQGDTVAMLPLCQEMKGTADDC